MSWLLFAAAALARPAVDAVGVHLADHSVAPPFGNVLPSGTLRPAVTLEGERAWLRGRHLALVPAARLTGWVHPNAGSGWRLGAALTGRATSGLGPFAELGLEVGVTHTLFGHTLGFADGAYTPSGYPGRLGPHGGFALGAGWDLGRRTDVPAAVVATYRWFAHGGWLPATGGIAPKGELGLGLRWSLGAGRA